ncbi:MAG: YtxH domain-containing protein [Spirochaetes bacterium]|nr:YtxH domain-containing protein [Spirochaetota bacterium]
MAEPIKLILYTVAGGALGFLYYRLIGCSTGACPITSRPVPSVIYGAMMGAMLGWR